ncbi:hypothetical protein Q8G47_28870, partial [Klebsiella pneumoniae]|uniref:hypothetical protein n=1 Tax=Klebsiella pneumoniae TaxID=573 RepID=UPI0030140D70
CDNKAATDVDLASVDEEVGCQQLMDSDEQDVSNDQMAVQNVTIPFKNIEIKQPKIMVAIYERRKSKRNSSPMRGNRMKAGAVCNQRT